MNRFRFIGKHFWLHSLVLLLLGVLPFGCSDARKVPDQSVFEPLNARQMKRALKAPFFDEFYSKYVWKFAECNDRIKVEFADVTWGDFYEYKHYKHYGNYSGYLKYKKSWEKSWRQRFGQYDEKVDSVIASYDQRVRDYFAQYLNVEFVEIENAYQPLSNRIEKTRFAFRLTAVCDTIAKCSFKLSCRDIQGVIIKGESFQTFTTTTLAPFDSSVIHRWTLPYPMKGNYDSFMVNKDYYYNKLKNERILIIDVRLQNRMEYSIYDFNMPESIRNCILSGFSAGKEYKTAEWKQVFEDLYGFSYDEGSDYYKNMSKYISDWEKQWIKHKYYREKFLDDRLYGRR